MWDNIMGVHVCVCFKHYIFLTFGDTDFISLQHLIYVHFYAIEHQQG